MERSHGGNAMSIGALVGLAAAIVFAALPGSLGAQAPASPCAAATATGTAQADTVNGTPRADRLVGMAGDDLIHGLQGNDTVYADATDRVCGCENVSRLRAAGS